MAKSKRPTIDDEKDAGDWKPSETRIAEKAHFGQLIINEGPPDKSSFQGDQKAARMGRELKGGPTDLSHSIGHGGDIETYNEVGKKPRPFKGNRINTPESD